jgi:hypothetical protein
MTQNYNQHYQNNSVSDSQIMAGKIVEGSHPYQIMQRMEPRTTMNYHQPMYPEYAPHPSTQYYPPPTMYPYYPSAPLGIMPNGQYYCPPMSPYNMPMPSMANMHNMSHMPSMPTMQNMPVPVCYSAQPLYQ